MGPLSFTGTFLISFLHFHVAWPTNLIPPSFGKLKKPVLITKTK